MPIAAMAKETAGTERAKNTVVLGLIAGWFGIGGRGRDEGHPQALAKKGEELVEANEKRLRARHRLRQGAPAARPRTRSATRAPRAR